MNFFVIDRFNFAVLGASFKKIKEFLIAEIENNSDNLNREEKRRMLDMIGIASTFEDIQIISHLYENYQEKEKTL